VLRIDTAEHVQTWTLDRPPANAIDGNLVKAIGDAAAAAQADDDVRCVVLRGNERFFSAGLDLKALAANGPDDVINFGWGDGIADLWMLEKPTIAAVAGHAIAGGAILALVCDVRIASSSPKKIGLNETAIGLPFPRGAFEIARHGLAPATFGPTILGAGLFGPEEAKTLGYVHEVVAPEALDETVHATAKRYADIPAIAYAENKRLFLEPAIERCRNESEEAKNRREAVWKNPDLMMQLAQRLFAAKK
jgi:enoyl-CoA hydratase/carnithine racemase